MLMGEPGRTQFDINFRVLGFAVRIHPLFWLAGVVLGASAGSGPGILIWLFAFFISILIHELGHSLAMRRFNQPSHIVLYLMGGLAIPEQAPFDYEPTYTTQSYRQPRNWILICAAGPGAGFVLAGILIVLIQLFGNGFRQVDGFPFFWMKPFETGYVHLQSLLGALLAINIFWGLINLLPVFPLDGGQIARELYTLRDPYTGTSKSLWLSVITAGIMFVIGLALRDYWFVILFGSLGLNSFLALRQIYGGGGFGGGGFGGGGFGGGGGSSGGFGGGGGGGSGWRGGGGGSDDDRRGW